MKWWITLGWVVVFLGRAAMASCGVPLEVGPFSRSSAVGVFPEGWEPMVFKKIKRQTRYTLVIEEGKGVVKAETRGGASGMIRRLAIDPTRWPILSWRWKISGVYEKGDAKKKSGDDYPARIYLAFAFDPRAASSIDRLKFGAFKSLYGEYPPVAVINYIWASHAELGEILPSTYTHRTMMVVVESGSEKAGRWISETRNILTDYKKAFGDTPPPISGVAIMTDADNTGESATAWYGDIQFFHAE